MTLGQRVTSGRPGPREPGSFSTVQPARWVAGGAPVWGPARAPGSRGGEDPGFTPAGVQGPEQLLGGAITTLHSFVLGEVRTIKNPFCEYVYLIFKSI